MEINFYQKLGESEKMKILFFWLFFLIKIYYVCINSFCKDTFHITWWGGKIMTTVFQQTANNEQTKSYLVNNIDNGMLNNVTFQGRTQNAPLCGQYMPLDGWAKNWSSRERTERCATTLARRDSNLHNSKSWPSPVIDPRHIVVQRIQIRWSRGPLILGDEFW